MPKLTEAGLISMIAIIASVTLVICAPNVQNGLILATSSISGYFGWLREK